MSRQDQLNGIEEGEILESVESTQCKEINSNALKVPRRKKKSAYSKKLNDHLTVAKHLIKSDRTHKTRPMSKRRSDESDRDRDKYGSLSKMEEFRKCVFPSKERRSRKVRQELRAERSSRTMSQEKENSKHSSDSHHHHHNRAKRRHSHSRKKDGKRNRSRNRSSEEGGKRNRSRNRSSEEEWEEEGQEGESSDDSQRRSWKRRHRSSESIDQLTASRHRSRSCDRHLHKWKKRSTETTRLALVTDDSRLKDNVLMRKLLQSEQSALAASSGHIKQQQADSNSDLSCEVGSISTVSSPDYTFLQRSPVPVESIELLSPVAAIENKPAENSDDSEIEVIIPHKSPPPLIELRSDSDEEDEPQLIVETEKPVTGRKEDEEDLDDLQLRLVALRSAVLKKHQERVERYGLKKLQEKKKDDPPSKGDPLGDENEDAGSYHPSNRTSPMSPSSSYNFSPTQECHTEQDIDIDDPDENNEQPIVENFENYEGSNNACFPNNYTVLPPQPLPPGVDVSNLPPEFTHSVFCAAPPPPPPPPQPPHEVDFGFHPPPPAYFNPPPLVHPTFVPPGAPPQPVPPPPHMGPQFVPNEQHVGPQFVPNDQHVGSQFVPNEQHVGPQFVPNEQHVGPQFVPNEQHVGPQFVPNEPRMGPSFVTSQVPSNEDMQPHMGSSFVPAGAPPNEAMQPHMASNFVPIHPPNTANPPRMGSSFVPAHTSHKLHNMGSSFVPAPTSNQPAVPCMGSNFVPPNQPIPPCMVHQSSFVPTGVSQHVPTTALPSTEAFAGRTVEDCGSFVPVSSVNYQNSSSVNRQLELCVPSENKTLGSAKTIYSSNSCRQLEPCVLTTANQDNSSVIDMTRHQTNSRQGFPKTSSGHHEYIPTSANQISDCSIARTIYSTCRQLEPCEPSSASTSQVGRLVMYVPSTQYPRVARQVEFCEDGKMRVEKEDETSHGFLESPFSKQCSEETRLDRVVVESNLTTGVESEDDVDDENEELLRAKLLTALSRKKQFSEKMQIDTGDESSRSSSKERTQKFFAKHVVSTVENNIESEEQMSVESNVDDEVVNREWNSRGKRNRTSANLVEFIDERCARRTTSNREVIDENCTKIITTTGETMCARNVTTLSALLDLIDDDNSSSTIVNRPVSLATTKSTISKQFVGRQLTTINVVPPQNRIVSNAKVNKQMFLKTMVPSRAAKKSTATVARQSKPSQEESTKFIIRLGQDSEEEEESNCEEEEEEEHGKAWRRKVILAAEEEKESPAISPVTVATSAPAPILEKRIDELLQAVRRQHEPSDVAISKAGNTKTSRLSPAALGGLKKSVPIEVGSPKSTVSKPTSTSTPAAVKHLPKSAQEEYRRLKQAMIEKEKQNRLEAARNRLLLLKSRQQVAATSCTTPPATATSCATNPPPVTESVSTKAIGEDKRGQSVTTGAVSGEKRQSVTTGAVSGEKRQSETTGAVSGEKRHSVTTSVIGGEKRQSVTISAASGEKSCQSETTSAKIGEKRCQSVTISEIGEKRSLIVTTSSMGEEKRCQSVTTRVTDDENSNQSVTTNAESGEKRQCETNSAKSGEKRCKSVTTSSIGEEKSCQNSKTTAPSGGNSQSISISVIGGERLVQIAEPSEIVDESTLDSTAVVEKSCTLSSTVAGKSCSTDQSSVLGVEKSCRSVTSSPSVTEKSCSTSPEKSSGTSEIGVEANSPSVAVESCPNADSAVIGGEKSCSAVHSSMEGEKSGSSEPDSVIGEEKSCEIDRKSGSTSPVVTSVKSWVNATSSSSIVADKSCNTTSGTATSAETSCQTTPTATSAEISCQTTPIATSAETSCQTTPIATSAEISCQTTPATAASADKSCQTGPSSATSSEKSCATLLLPQLGSWSSETTDGSTENSSTSSFTNPAGEASILAEAEQKLIAERYTTVDKLAELSCEAMSVVACRGRVSRLQRLLAAECAQLSRAVARTRACARIARQSQAVCKLLERKCIELGDGCTTRYRLPTAGEELLKARSESAMMRTDEALKEKQGRQNQTRHVTLNQDGGNSCRSDDDDDDLDSPAVLEKDDSRKEVGRQVVNEREEKMQLVEEEEEEKMHVDQDAPANSRKPIAFKCLPDYVSPLNYLQNSAGASSARVESSLSIFCPYDLMGTCRDESCPFQHSV